MVSILVCFSPSPSHVTPNNTLEADFSWNDAITNEVIWNWWTDQHHLNYRYGNLATNRSHLVETCALVDWAIRPLWLYWTWIHIQPRSFMWLCGPAFSTFTRLLHCRIWSNIWVLTLDCLGQPTKFESMTNVFNYAWSLVQTKQDVVVFFAYQIFEHMCYYVPMWFVGIMHNSVDNSYNMSNVKVCCHRRIH